MANLPVESLPLVKVFPLLMLAVLAYGIAEFAYVHFKPRRANPGEYGMALKGLGFMMLSSLVIGPVFGPVTKLLFADAGAFSKNSCKPRPTTARTMRKMYVTWTPHGEQQTAVARKQRALLQSESNASAASNGV